MERLNIHISVRNLVEFIFREGDIDNRSDKLQSPDVMLEGTRIHKKIQKSMGEDYQPEVPLKMEIEEEDYILTIEGRADGVFTKDDGSCWIDEIKGMYRKVELMEEPVYVHKAQAMCYAYIFAYQNELKSIGVQMTYCNIENEEKKYFTQEYDMDELHEWFTKLYDEYKKWATFQAKWKKKRQKSIKELKFPFEYRKGQDKLVKDVYRTILREKNLFLQAPTGVGKTISTIFPAVKAVGEGLSDRIFYLTAKTITASVARNTFELLVENGYEGKVINLTAKEKLCFCEEMECNPINCPYAKGHYDRVNECVYDILQDGYIYTREKIIEYARKYNVCPFEMSLDLAVWVDDIICDYNYVFDPNVHLKRFFQEGIHKDYIFLVDEAHNLVDRSREMYSASIYKEDFLNVKKIIKPYSKKIEKILDKCNKILLGYKRECETYKVYDSIGNLFFSLMRLNSELDEFLQKPMEFAGKKEVLEFYFQIRNFINIYELVDEHYVIYGELQEDNRFMIKLLCVDPSLNLQNCMDRARSTILFSATFLPIDYYKKLLSDRKDDYAIYADSTFTKEQSLIAIANDVSTLYSRRNDDEYEKIALYIKRIIECKKGNYMVFFPSYKFMNEIYDRLIDKLDAKVDIVMQDTNMTEISREEFLMEFKKERNETLIGFCVLGGIFGEGIDLKNDCLIGSIIVGTGIPNIGNEREILKNYYDRVNNEGFNYAFRYPGINKVLQAAGRVIRTAEDKGIIVLLDERFLKREYHRLYPREWEDIKVCGINDVSTLVSKFWE